MEDALELYERPLCSSEPVVCIDEKPVVLHRDSRPASPCFLDRWRDGITNMSVVEQPMCSAVRNPKGIQGPARAFVIARQECEGRTIGIRSSIAPDLQKDSMLPISMRNVGKSAIGRLIPPGKEDTVRGRLAARMNEAMARVARFESERKPEQ
jgi:hypothetical protein